MKRISITCLILFSVVHSLKAQTIKASLELGRKDALPRYFEVSNADKGLVTFGNMTKNSSRYLGLFKYDADFKYQWSKQVLEQNGRANVDFMTVIGENIFVFVSEFFPKENTIRTFFYRYNLEGKLLNERKTISELPDEKEHRVDLKYVVSLNKKRLLCYKNLNTQTEKERILYYIFDETGEMTQRGSAELPYEDDKFQVRKVLVSNQGSLFILGKFFIENKVKSPDDFEFRVIRFSTDASMEIEQYSLKFGDKYITDINIKIDRNENIFAAGFYSNRNSYEITGTVFCKYNVNGEQEAAVIQKFTDDFLSKFLSGKQIEKGQELKNFFLDNIVLRSDGGVLLVAERYYTTYTSMLDVYGYWIDRQVHHYDEIIVNSISAEGMLEWSTVVPKYQASENNVNLSYFSMATADGLTLVYEDSPKGLPQTLYANHVEMDGTTSPMKPFLKNDERNISFFPRSSEQISNSEGVLVYFRGREKTYSIIKVDFTE